MKWTSFLLIGLLMAPFAGAAHQGYELPLYVRDFLGRLNISADPIEHEADLNVAIKERIEAVGCQRVVKAARDAVDPDVGGAYYLVRQTENALVISRRYYLEERIQILSIYIVPVAGTDQWRAAFSIATVAK